MLRLQSVPLCFGEPEMNQKRKKTLSLLIFSYSNKYCWENQAFRRICLRKIPWDMSLQRAPGRCNRPRVIARSAATKQSPSRPCVIARSEVTKQSPLTFRVIARSEARKQSPSRPRVIARSEATKISPSLATNRRRLLRLQGGRLAMTPYPCHCEERKRRSNLYL